MEARRNYKDFEFLLESEPEAIDALIKTLNIQGDVLTYSWWDSDVLADLYNNYKFPTKIK